MADFLVQSLRLCAAAGMVRVGLVALDGTKVAANAADRANRTLAKLQEEVTQILREVAETDQAEDRDGRARGAELPPELASPAGRLARLRQAKAQLEAEAAERQRRYEQRVAELAAAARARGQQPRPRITPRRRDEAPDPKATANTTDPDSRYVRGSGRTLQGYNAQAVATVDQVVVAAALTQQANDVQQLAPMLAATTATLAAAGITDRPGKLAADSGYWSIANLTSIPDAPELLIPPARHGRHGKPRKDGRPSASRSDGLRAAMRARLDSENGKASYGLRSQTIEPVFGQLKTVQGAQRFMRRGLGACEAEWKLLCGTHNLLKLWRHTRRQTPNSAARRLSSGEDRFRLPRQRSSQLPSRPGDCKSRTDQQPRWLAAAAAPALSATGCIPSTTNVRPPAEQHPRTPSWLTGRHQTLPASPRTPSSIPLTTLLAAALAPQEDEAVNGRVDPGTDRCAGPVGPVPYSPARGLAPADSSLMFERVLALHESRLSHASAGIGGGLPLDELPPDSGRAALELKQMAAAARQAGGSWYRRSLAAGTVSLDLRDPGQLDLLRRFGPHSIDARVWVEDDPEPVIESSESLDGQPRRHLPPGPG